MEGDKNYMIKGKQMMFLSIAIAVTLLIQSVTASAMQITEVLSVRTGKGPDNIGNQFVEVPLEPFNGFAVDTKENILISDTRNSRVMVFSKDKKKPDLFTPAKDMSLFIPQSLCLDEEDVVYVHNTGEEEIIVFSPSGNVLRSYRPALDFEGKHKKVPIIYLTCGGSTVKIVFGIKQPKTISPVFQDEYDKNFKRINRKVFDNEVSYYNMLEETNKSFEKHFEDLYGNIYGYPFVKDWYGKFLPLIKYSPDGTQLGTIDGTLLTKNTQYKVYDYYTGRNIDWLKMKGKYFLIVNWYVTPSGTIYVLLANNDYVKVLKINE